MDEFGRVWKKGMYFYGVIQTPEDLKRYTPPMEYALRFFDEKRVADIRTNYPDRCLFFGTHIGPFMGAYMGMGMEHMFRICQERYVICPCSDERTDRSGV